MQSKGPDVLLGSPKGFQAFGGFLQSVCGRPGEIDAIVAYKGKLGISKDFPGADDSHNLTQAHIISDYLRSVKSVGEIDLEEMYNNYIAKWNADVSEEDSWLGFKGNSALSFVVVLDTLDFILSGKDVSEQSFLLSGEERIWRILSRSRCWADVNEWWNNLKG